MQDLRLRDNRPTLSNRFSFGSWFKTGKASESPTTVKHVVPIQENKEFVREALQVHNDFRRKHGVEPLRLNDDLSKLAQQWGKY